ncbi:unnamed protein product [Prorocentrum cordatum]|uniref:ER membrane protein complex subunit 1 n=1 Tax=Prorocentrum cordatum TaxID=2364126 RepID=A0ABN9RUG5_9DINO|nr:unnamed protein product [Polarella glacialis]
MPDLILVLVFISKPPASFVTHTFAKTGHSQLAVVDAFDGTPKHALFITEEGLPHRGSRREELNNDTVVAIRDGRYRVEIGGADGFPVASQRLDISGLESQVVLVRTGADAAVLSPIHEALLVFPQSCSSVPSGSEPVKHLHVFYVALIIGVCALVR